MYQLETILYKFASYNIELNYSNTGRYNLK